MRTVPDCLFNSFRVLLGFVVIGDLLDSLAVACGVDGSDLVLDESATFPSSRKHSLSRANSRGAMYDR